MTYFSGKDWKGKANPNMNLKNTPKITAKTPIGKFRRDLGKFTRERIPDELLDLYDWYKGMDTREINYVLELKNIYGVLKTNLLNSLYEKFSKGEQPTKAEVEQIKLVVDIMEKSHKLKYGDKKVIEHIVTAKDVRKQVFGNREIIDVKVDDNRGNQRTELRRKR